jgi:hypothetical protein
VAVSENKVSLKGTNISRYLRHAKDMTTALKAVSTTGVPKKFPTLATSLGKVHSY